MVYFIFIPTFLFIIDTKRQAKVIIKSESAQPIFAITDGGISLIKKCISSILFIFIIGPKPKFKCLEIGED